MAARMRGLDAVLPATPADRLVSYLPSAHIADRFWPTTGPRIAYGVRRSPRWTIRRQLPAALVQTSGPTSWVAVPRIWEKIRWPRWRPSGVSRPGGDAGGGPGAVRAGLGLDQADWVLSGAAPIARRRPALLPRWPSACRSARAGRMSETVVPATTINPLARRPHRHRRQAMRRRRAQARRGRRAAGRAATSSWWATATTRNAPPRRSTPTAGCAPATSPKSTPTAT